MRTKQRAQTIIILISFIITFIFCCYVETIYTKTVIVTHVQEENVTTMDAQGNLWIFNGEGFQEGNIVKIFIDNNHTSNTSDDKIIKTKKINA